MSVSDEVYLAVTANLTKETDFSFVRVFIASFLLESIYTIITKCMSFNSSRNSVSGSSWPASVFRSWEMTG